MCHVTEEWRNDFIQMKRESRYFTGIFDKADSPNVNFQKDQKTLTTVIKMD